MLLSLLIIVLALVDSYIHLRLSGALFGGPGGGGPPTGAQGDAGALGPALGASPPGSPPPGGLLNQLPLPLDQIVLLNGLGYLVLILIFCLGWGILGRRRWLIDALLLIYVLATIGGWYSTGMPNPMNLGYISTTIEVILLLALLVHLRIVTGRVPWRP